MDESAKPRDGRRIHGATVVMTTVLSLAAVASLCGGVLAAMIVLVAGQHGGKMNLDYVLVAAGLVIVGALAGAALWAAGILVRRQGRASMLKAGADRARPACLDEPVRHAQAANKYHSPLADMPEGPVFEPAFAASRPAPLAPAGQARPRDESQVLEEILAQLKELNDNILMTDEQRREKAQRRRERLRRKLVNDIRDALDAADFARAGRGLAELKDKAPGDEQIEPLRKRLHDARRAARDEEIAAATRRAGDLMATGAFDQAVAEVFALAQRHPDEPAVASLLDRVRREGRMFNNQRRDRMYNEIVRLGEARQWRQALGAARRYIQAFPTGAGTDAVRTMLATIENNARIEEVRELRDHIRDLIERRRYGEAVEYAQDVIERFPGTRAAEELGRQMNRLRELARSPSSNGRDSRQPFKAE